MKYSYFMLFVSVLLFSCSSLNKSQIIGHWKFNDFSQPLINENECGDVEKYNEAIKNAKMNWFIQFNEDNTFLFNGPWKHEGKYSLTDIDKTLVLVMETRKTYQEYLIKKLSSGELIFEVLEEKRCGVRSEEILFSWIKE